VWGSKGERDDKACAALWVVGSGDAALVGGDYLPGDGDSKAGSFAAGAVAGAAEATEPVKDRGAVLFGDAGAIVSSYGRYVGEGALLCGALLVSAPLQ
jgi:hypothetical protein